MTISKKQLEQARLYGIHEGIKQGKEQAKQDLLLIRQSGVVEISRAVADLALANAKLTYALSRITDKLL